MTEKQKVTITVTGQPGTGKSTLMALICHVLGTHMIDATQYPLPGGSVVKGQLRDRLRHLMPKIEVEIVEAQEPRR